MNSKAFRRGVLYGCITTMCIYHYGYSVTAFIIATSDHNWNGMFTAFTGILASTSGLMFSIHGLILSIKENKK